MDADHKVEFWILLLAIGPTKIASWAILPQKQILVATSDSEPPYISEVMLNHCPLSPQKLGPDGQEQLAGAFEADSNTQISNDIGFL